jgi:hypothetical protein
MEPPAAALAIMMGSPWRAKVAVTEVLEFIVTVQVGDVPEHPPDHPVKVELAAGLAVRVTTVPALKLVPVGLLLTVPVPAPDLVTLRV